MSDRTLHCRAAAKAITEDVCLGNFEIIEQRGNIVGEVFRTDIALDVGRAPVTLHFNGDHFARLRKFLDLCLQLLQPERTRDAGVCKRDEGFI